VDGRADCHNLANETGTINVKFIGKGIRTVFIPFGLKK
jgi:hypothetical protein